MVRSGKTVVGASQDSAAVMNSRNLTYMRVLPPPYASVDSRAYVLRPRDNNDDEALSVPKTLSVHFLGWPTAYGRESEPRSTKCGFVSHSNRPGFLGIRKPAQTIRSSQEYSARHEPSYAARRYRWCRPPTLGIEITLPCTRNSISRGFGELRSRERCARSSW